MEAPATHEPLIEVAIFRGKTDSTPKPKKLPLSKFLDGLINFEERQGKDGRLLSPTIYKPPGAHLMKNPEGEDAEPALILDETGGLHRMDANVEAISAFVVDMDGGFDPDDFMESWKEWTYAVHSTFSSTPEHPKWRAAFPLKEKVSAEDWPKVYAKLVHHLTYGTADPACKDCSRMYYAPAYPPGGEEHAFAHKNEGQLLDHTTLPEVEAEPQEAAAHKDHPILDSNGVASRDGLRPGDDFNERGTWDEQLYRANWTHGYRRGGYDFWVRDGKNKSDGISARTGVGTHGDRFYCWSSNANVPARKLLTKFGLYAHLFHNGDHTAAAKDLAEQGYGSPARRPTRSTEPSKEGPVSFPLTDAGNAERLAARHGDLIRYIDKLGGWFVYDGLRYKKDETGQIVQLAKETVRSIHADAAEETDPDERKKISKHALQGESRRSLENMIALAQSEGPIPATATDMDADPWLLNLRNGVLDLKAGRLIAHSPYLNLTKLANASFEPDAQCPRWLRFLDEIFLGDQDVIAYVQRTLGYCLTGNTREQCTFLLEGEGSNGKSTLIEVVRAILGDYAATLAFDALLLKGKTDTRPEFARCVGARLLSAVEATKGRAFDEALIKQITGGDTISVRELYKTAFDYRPQFKLVMAVNHLPTIRTQDHGTWRRFRRIHFSRIFQDHEKDANLSELLLEERDGILVWMSWGTQLWIEKGLLPPKAVQEATNDYRSTMDPVAAFASDRCVFSPGEQIEGKLLWEAYADYCRETGDEPVARNAFLPAFAHRGVKLAPGKKKGRVYVGVRLTDSQESLSEATGDGGTQETPETGNLLSTRTREEGLLKLGDSASSQVQKGASPLVSEPPSPEPGRPETGAIAAKGDALTPVRVRGAI